MTYFERLIRYHCANPDHQRSAAQTLADTMTIHDRSWAYCPHDVRVPGHAWELANPEAPVLVTEPADLQAPG